MWRFLFKVVHVVRDPRAMYSSMKKGENIWKSYVRNVTHMCSVLNNDFQVLSENLSPSR